MSLNIFYTNNELVDYYKNDKKNIFIHNDLHENNMHIYRQLIHSKQLGKMLLVETIKTVLPDFETSELFYVNGHPRSNRVCASLSYSKDIVIAAASKKFKIGIDIEYIQNIDIDEYNTVLCQEERDFLSQSKNKVFSFYYIWTRKEALIKACGFGLQYPLSDLNSLQTEVSLLISPIRWHLSSQILCNDYVFSCACESSITLPAPTKLTFSVD